MKKILLIVFSIFIAFSLYANEATIELSWDLFSETSLKGFLVLPQKNAQEGEILPGNLPTTSENNKVEVVSPQSDFEREKQTWKIESFESGIYHFFVSGAFSNDEFSQNMVSWNRKIKVKIEINNQIKTFKPKEKKGNIWHVFDLIGSSRKVIEINDILPRMKSVYGNAMNAVTGNMIPDVNIVIKNKHTNQVIKKCKTDKKGEYKTEIPIGSFEVTFSKKGYIGYSSPLSMWKHEIPVCVNAHLSPILKDVERRIVLSWGKYPRDLDSHLIGPDPINNKKFHISYRNMHVFNDQHFLDRDDIRSYGPETITMKKLDPGTYKYYVHDYSNRNDSNSKALSYSNATVRLYEKDRLVKECKIPENRTGRIWNVMTVNGRTGEISFIGTIE